MHLLLTLLLGHLFADFPLQTNRLAMLKNNSFIGVFIHVMIYMTVTALLLNDPIEYWPLLAGLTVVHFMIDSVKRLHRPRNELLYFIIDQLAHLISLLMATYIAYQIWTPTPVGILPTEFLWVAVPCASALAIMVFSWIWTNSLTDEQLNHSSILRWTKHQMLTLEQRLGLILVILVILGQRVA